MLSKDNWISSKGAKLAGLSKKEIDKRYDQYRLSRAVAGPKVLSRKAKQKAGGPRKGPYSKGAGGSQKLRTSYSSLSKCSKLYGLALIDPFSVPEPPCIPDLVAIPSFKCSVTERGVINIGMQGVGFLVTNPFMAANDVPDTYGTSSSYNSTSIDVALAGVLSRTNNSPFSVTQFGVQGLAYRLVGCGIKLRYMGNEMSRGGRVLMYREPTNSGMTFPTTAPDLLLDRETSTAPVDRKEHYAVYRPAKDTDRFYQTTFAGNNASLCIVIEAGTAAAGQTFEYEKVAWFEFIGNPTPAKTMSHSDPVGDAAVMQALPATQPTKPPEEETRNFFDSILYYANEALSFVEPIVTGLGGVQNILPIVEALFL